MLDIDENGLYLSRRRLERRFPEAELVTEVADIRDPERIRDLFLRHRPLDVFHAAAHKHVPLMESAPCEAIKNNVVGTKHVAEAASLAGAQRFVYISTDKAVKPSSVMGASKRLGEEIVRTMARTSRTHFCAVRFGNVLGSAGSVVPVFRDQIATGGPVSVTHPEVRRYFMTISEAVALVLTAAYGDYGELCILDMGEQIRIVDLARNMITMAGLVPEVDIPIVFIGLRPGEKLFEELMTEEEEQTRRVSDKIFVADCPSPARDLHSRIDELAAAANAEKAERVVESLRALIPSYRPRPASDPEAGQTATERASAKSA
jgi:FlaA1/EpsC-like NDP-sugar epimerase